MTTEGRHGTKRTSVAWRQRTVSMSGGFQNTSSGRGASIVAVVKEVPEAQRAYLVSLADALKELLADQLVGVYVHGSIALGGFHPKTSDIDVLGICTQSLSSDAKALVASSLLGLAAPARGLEFSLLTGKAAQKPVRKVPFELHVALEPEVHVVDGATHEGDEDLVLAIEICRRAGIALYGPPPEETFAPIPEEWLLDMCDRELAWIQDHLSRTPAESAVLQACRAWRYAEERVLSSKVESGRWALGRGVPEGEIIEAALARKLGVDVAEVDQESALALLAKVRRLIEET
jgi:predicted nucleotidyltransferase